LAPRHSVSSSSPQQCCGLQDKALQGRLFYKQAFGIYGGVAGLYDYGPPGTAVKSNITQFWRQHFVFAESMLELECPAVTPEAVLKPSGHVDRFVDFMVSDEQKNCFRADHLLEDNLKAIIADAKSTADQKKVLCPASCACPTSYAIHCCYHVRLGRSCCMLKR
jgi:glycyl-tRNA synthetase